MAKISPVSIKYMIHATFEAEGMVEKPDVIGALFGQTEGLLGTDLEMRDLQKEGKIGRIEVDSESKNGKTTGKINIPSAMDKTETTLIAAAIETIERVGPSNAKITIEKIEDVRENKRGYILERAKKLLESIDEKMPKTREMTQNLKDDARTSKIKEYGAEKLPAGDTSGDELIIVEGRADVVNLLRNNVDNVIGMNGTILPDPIKELSKSKEVTLFLDGDRGGKLIAKNVIENAKVNFVAVAPDGKEVEELEGKEILMSLRKKVPVEEFMKTLRYESRFERTERRETKPAEEVEEAGVNLDDNKDKLRAFLDEVENSKNAIILDRKLNVIDNIPTRAIFSVLERTRKAYVVVVDSATPNVIKAAEENNVKNVVAKNFSYGSEKVNLVSL